MNGITGGAGFIGSHLADALHTGERGVRVLDGLVGRPGDPATRQRGRLEKLPGSIEVIEGDIRDREALRRFLPGCKRVYHLAHFVGANHSTSDAKRCLETNVFGTQVLLEEMEREGIDQLILVSTAAVYGELKGGPHREDQAVRPTNPYGASMVAAEALACAWQAQTRGTLVIVRPFNVYGPRMRPDAAVFRFLAAAQGQQPLMMFGDGRTTRDFVYIADVLKVLIEARRIKSTHRPTILNVATGVETSLMDLVGAIRRTTGCVPQVEFSPRQLADPHRSVGSRKRLKELLGIEELLPLDEGLEKTAGWVAHAQHARHFGD